MRPNRTAGRFCEIVNGLQIPRSRRISVHVKDKDAATVKTCEPELAPIVGKPTMVRLVTTLHRRAADHFTVVRRAGLYVDGHKFICAISESFNAECPYVNEF